MAAPEWIYARPRYTVSGVVQALQDDRWRECGVHTTVEARTPEQAAQAILETYTGYDLVRWHGGPRVYVERSEQ